MERVYQPKSRDKNDLCRQYGEKDGHMLMKAIIAQQKSYNNEQERKRQKTQEMNAKKMLGGIEGNVGNENNNIDLVMASNTQVIQDHNINNYELCVERKDLSKKGEFKKPNIDIENYVEEDRWWDYSNECNKWEGGGLRNNYEPEQNIEC